LEKLHFQSFASSKIAFFTISEELYYIYKPPAAIRWGGFFPANAGKNVDTYGKKPNLLYLQILYSDFVM